MSSNNHFVNISTNPWELQVRPADSGPGEGPQDHGVVGRNKGLTVEFHEIIVRRAHEIDSRSAFSVNRKSTTSARGTRPSRHKNR